MLGRHIARRKDVGQEEDLLVGEPLRDLERPDVGEWHANELRLAPRVAAVEVGVAEQPGARESIEGLGHLGIRVRIVAERRQALAAGPAGPAGDRKRDHDAGAGPERPNIPSRPRRPRP